MDTRLKLGLTLAVLAAHLALLHTLGAAWQPATRMASMTAPMFTRELRAAAPPSPPPKASNLDKKKAFRQHPRDHSAIKNIATTLHAPATPEYATPTQTVNAAPDALADNTVKPASDLEPSPPAPAPVADKPLPATLPTDSWPGDTRLSYRLLGHYRGPISGDARVQWQREGERYQVRVELDLSGVTIYSMTSQGQVTPQGLEPAAYEEKRLGTKPLQIGMDAGQLRLQDGNKVDRPDGLQDTASQFVELGHQFATGKATLTVGKSVQLWLARPNAVAEWTYDIVALDTLQSERLGAVPAYHLKPRPLAKPGGPVTAEMWFAPTLQYLPVRIKITLNAETWVDLNIEKIEQASPPRPAEAPPQQP